MILYFTGTGNSKFVADYLADKLDDKVISLNKIIKNNERLVCTSDKTYVLVAPVYAWRLPEIVEQTIKSAQLEGCKNFYCIATMGENSGDTDKYIKNIIEDKGMSFKGYIGVAMQNNYLTMEKMPSKDNAEKALNNIIPKLETISNAIKNLTPLYKDDKTPMAALMSGVVNKGFSKYMLKNPAFTVDSNCINCGKCVEYCPVNNIELVNDIYTIRFFLSISNAALIFPAISFLL